MHSILRSFFFSLFILTAAHAAPLKLVSDVWPPFTDERGWPRLSVDLVTEALKRSGIESETKIVDFTKVMPGLVSGQYDGSAAFWKDAQREKILLYSKPYFSNQLILVGVKDSDVSATSFADLKGKKIGIVGTYSYGDIATSKDGPAFVKGRDYQENLNRLLSKEVDYVLLDSFVVEHMTETQGAKVKKFLAIGTTPLVKRPLYFVLRKNVPDATAIMEKFNSTIETMVKDGSLQKILKLKSAPIDLDN